MREQSGRSVRKRSEEKALTFPCQRAVVRLFAGYYLLYQLVVAAVAHCLDNVMHLQTKIKTVGQKILQKLWCRLTKSNSMSSCFTGFCWLLYRVFQRADLYQTCQILIQSHIHGKCSSLSDLQKPHTHYPQDYAINIPAPNTMGHSFQGIKTVAVAREESKQYSKPLIRHF